MIERRFFLGRKEYYSPQDLSSSQRLERLAKTVIPSFEGEGYQIEGSTLPKDLADDLGRSLIDIDSSAYSLLVGGSHNIKNLVEVAGSEGAEETLVSRLRDLADSIQSLIDESTSVSRKLGKSIREQINDDTERILKRTNLAVVSTDEEIFINYDYLYEFLRAGFSELGTGPGEEFYYGEEYLSKFIPLSKAAEALSSVVFGSSSPPEVESGNLLGTTSRGKIQKIFGTKSSVLDQEVLDRDDTWLELMWLTLFGLTKNLNNNESFDFTTHVVKDEYNFLKGHDQLSLFKKDEKGAVPNNLLVRRFAGAGQHGIKVDIGEPDKLTINKALEEAERDIENFSEKIAEVEGKLEELDLDVARGTSQIGFANSINESSPSLLRQTRNLEDVANSVNKSEIITGAKEIYHSMSMIERVITLKRLANQIGLATIGSSVDDLEAVARSDHTTRIFQVLFNIALVKRLREVVQDFAASPQNVMSIGSSLQDWSRFESDIGAEAGPIPTSPLRIYVGRRPVFHVSSTGDYISATFVQSNTDSPFNFTDAYKNTNGNWEVSSKMVGSQNDQSATFVGYNYNDLSQKFGGNTTDWASTRLVLTYKGDGSGFTDSSDADILAPDGTTLFQVSVDNVNFNNKQVVISPSSGNTYGEVVEGHTISQGSTEAEIVNVSGGHINGNATDPGNYTFMFATLANGSSEDGNNTYGFRCMRMMIGENNNRFLDKNNTAPSPTDPFAIKPNGAGNDNGNYGYETFINGPFVDAKESMYNTDFVEIVSSSAEEDKVSFGQWNWLAVRAVLTTTGMYEGNFVTDKDIVESIR